VAGGAASSTNHEPGISRPACCVLHSVPKTSTFYILNNCVKNYPILMIFGTLNPEKIWHENLTGLSTSPVRCSYCTLGNPKKSFSTTAFYKCPKNVHLLYYFLNNCVKKYPILMIFGTLNPEKIWHENLTGLSTSPVTCSYFTLKNPKKSFSTVLFIHTSDTYFWFYVLSEENKL